MSRQPHDQTNAPPSKRRYVEWLTVFALLFVLQTGLVPFDFRNDGATGSTPRFFLAIVNDLTLPDIMSNIFLYVPLGVLVPWTLLRRNWGSLRAWCGAVAVCAAVSALIEWLQAYSAQRVSSVIDLTSNVVGGGVGASVSWIARFLVPRWIGAALCEFHERPRTTLLKTYVALLIVVAVMPFSFSFDVARLKHAVKNSVFVPFGTSVGERAVKGAAITSADPIALERAEWAHWKRWSRWGAEGVSFVVLALLLQPVLRGDYRFRRRATVALTWWLAGGLAIGLSALQLPVVSRGCDVTDIAFRCFGLGLGLLGYGGRRGLGSLSPDQQDRRRRRWAKSIAFGTVAYVLFNGLIPFRFDASGSGPATAIASSGFLPFFAYFMARFDLMMSDVMEKFACYVVFAASMAAYWTRGRAGVPKRRRREILILALALATLIEILQVYMPVRVASLTDVIVALGGGLAGLIGQKQAARFYRFATAHRPLGHMPKAVADGRSGAISAIDELMATLADVHPEAPVERLPTPLGHPRS